MSDEKPESNDKQERAIRAIKPEFWRLISRKVEDGRLYLTEAHGIGTLPHQGAILKDTVIENGKTISHAMIKLENVCVKEVKDALGKTAGHELSTSN